MTMVPASTLRYTSASLLMHAALAQVSPEVQTLDAIISWPRAAPTTSPTCALTPTLPLELLLLIRSQLILTITDRLVTLSNDALVLYEDSIRSLLCDDCLDWHEDVYGSSVWQWQRFSGRCWCNSARGSLGGDEDETLATVWFRDPLHWLEDHLSHSPYMSLCSPPSVTPAIWTLVRDVLREYHCDLVQDISPKSTFAPTFRWPWSEPQPPNDRALIFPSTSPDEPQVDRPLLCRLSQTCHDRRCHQVILHRVERDLGIPLFSSVECMSSYSARPSGRFTFASLSNCLQSSSTTSVSSRPRQERSSLPSHSQLLSRARHIALDPFVLLGDFISNTTMFLLCVPLSILTMIAHVVCYYSRPSALRVF